MASRVHFCPIVAVQSKLEASSPPDSRAEYCSVSSAVDHRQRVPRLHLQQAQRWARPPVQVSPSDGPSSSWTYNHISKCSVGLDHLYESSPSDGYNSSWTFNSFSKCSVGPDHLYESSVTQRWTQHLLDVQLLLFSKWWSRHRSSVMQRNSGILGADSFHRLWARPAAILSWQTPSTFTSEARVSSS